MTPAKYIHDTHLISINTCSSSQSVTTSMSLSHNSHLPLQYLSLLAFSISVDLSLSPAAVCARCCVLHKLYSSGSSSSTSSRGREDTRERTAPHLSETAVLSRNCTSSGKHKRVSGRAREGLNEGDRERECIFTISIVNIYLFFLLWGCKDGGVRR